jgi:hypothetical protein
VTAQSLDMINPECFRQRHHGRWREADPGAGGSVDPPRDEVVRIGGLWFAGHNASGMPDRKARDRSRHCCPAFPVPVLQ